MLGAQDPLADGQQRGELVAGPGHIPRTPGPAGEVVAEVQGVRVLGAQHPLEEGQQGGVLVAGPGRIPRHPSPGGEAGASSQGVAVLSSVGVILPAGVGDQLEEVAGSQIAAAIAEVPRDPPHTAAGQVKDSLGVRQQRRAYRPGLGQLRVVGDGGLDQSCGGLPPLAGQLGWHLVGGDGLDQPVHRHRPLGRRGDQRIAAQRRDRVTDRQRGILQQGHHHGGYALPELPGQARAGLQQQPQRDRLRGAERQQPQHPAAPGAECCKSSNASRQVVATV